MNLGPSPRRRFGVNYVPSQNWWYCWLDWDEDSIRRDLEAIANLGMDHLRVHLIWSYFQPNEREFCRSSVSRLLNLLEIAASVNLEVCVTVLNGWLSGFEFYPSWLSKRNMFTDPAAIESEIRLFHFLANEIARHPAFMGFDLGNELSWTMQKSHPATCEEADQWQMLLLAECASIAPGKIHVNGVDHIPWFFDEGFSRKCLATVGTMTSLHCWIGFTGALSRYGALGIGSSHLIEYSVELALAFHQDDSRQVWIQEFGIADTWIEPSQKEEFVEKTFQNILECRGVWGATWWCSHDIDRRFFGFGEMEFDLGLLTTENKIKPAGQVIRSIIDRERRSPTEPVVRSGVVKLLASDFGHLRNPNSGWSLASRFMDQIREGGRPSILF